MKTVNLIDGYFVEVDPMNYTLKLADAFRMKVLDFAKFTGYSKQALYQMLDGTNGCCSTRMLATVNLLELKSKEILEADIKEAEKRAEQRKYALDNLKEQLKIVK